MANLRIVSVSITSSTEISAKFTENLYQFISPSNITITSQLDNVPDPTVLSVSINGSILDVTTQPLTPLADYIITFKSTSLVSFKSLNGDANLIEDGVSNSQLITAHLENDNAVLNYLTSFFQTNVYDLDTSSNIYKYLQGTSSVLSKSLYDIKQLKNENYLSYTVVDEQHTRGSGAFDRLNEGSSYEVLRVGTTPTGTTSSQTSNISTFPSYPISLLATGNSDTLLPGTSDTKGYFNVDSLILNLNKNNIISVSSIVFIYQSTSYTYNIDGYGYQLLESKYDPDYAFTYLQLQNNQVRLNEQVLQDPNFSLENIVSVNVNYQYKNTGKIIDKNSLSIYSIMSSTREVLPPIENLFTLNHAPIVDSSGNSGSVGNVSFIDPNALPGSSHPAFLYEVNFRFDYLPSAVGEFSIDYSTGNVYVYGASQKDGTGAYPPVATYYYKHTYEELIDYVYDNDNSDIIALPNGNLLNSNSIVIKYNYEQVLESGIDYVANTHKEALNESIGNGLLALNILKTQNSPITNVFRIFNQTSGEVYTASRWNDNKVYFKYNQAPNIEVQVRERASFKNILNEFLFVSSVQSFSSYNIFKITLDNNNIVAATEDCLGSSINTSVSFSNTTVFSQERYFDNSLSISTNNMRLINIGDYQIDYTNGIVWVKVSTTQDMAIGNVSYKYGYISPNFPHIISADDIYYQLSPLAPKLKTFPIQSISDGSILPSSIDFSNEQFLNNNYIYPYQISSGSVGTFESGGTFVSGVSNTINFVRGLFEYSDLVNNTTPINFAQIAQVNGKNITVSSPLTFTEYQSVKFNGTNYYVQANTNLTYLSSNITLTVSIVRLSDNAQLWNGSGTVTLGSPLTLNLPGINSPAANDAVILTYSYSINNLSEIVVDYNKGDYYIDYTYLADEIVVSYEYGEDVIDFRQSSALSEGDTYYISYKVGALRDALLRNFGTLINVPILNSLDTTFERERYRDALIAAMQSFSQGPTITSIKNIVENIAHTPPEISESAFNAWSLGNNLLEPEPINTTGSFELSAGKYGSGVVVDTQGQSITFPVASNLSFEQGTLECWVTPEWQGIDNKSDIIITITKNGSSLLAQNIFIGSSAYHPNTTQFNNNTLTLNTDQANKVFGVPNENKSGVFIYYAPDSTGSFNRWYVDVMDGYEDGYSVKNYVLSITTTGKLYDVKSTITPTPATSKIFAGTNNISFSITGTSLVAQGVTFIADNQHYIFDFGESISKNRFSLYKDESGYINFRVIDKNSKIYSLSSNISNWSMGQSHQIAVSWLLNSKNNRDEMHLFVDGFECPNQIKYGDKINPYLNERYRTIDPEKVIGVVNKNIYSSNDLTTTSGSSAISSTYANFSSLGINAGDTIYITGSAFSTSGYTINSVNGNSLILNTSMPITASNLSYTINKNSFTIQTEADLYSNAIVSLLHSSLTGTDLTVSSGSATVSSTSTNFSTQKVQPGSLIRIISNSALTYYTILSVSGNSLTLDSSLTFSGSNLQFFVYPNSPQEIPGERALHPSYQITRDSNSNVILTLVNSALKNDIVLIETLGLNLKLIDQKAYVWGNTSNIVKTMLPAPVFTNDVKVYHWLLSATNIGPSNSTLSSGIFISNHIITDQPSTSDGGRTLSVSIYGTNIDFSSPVTVTINGTINSVTNQNLTLTFSSVETLTTSSKFSAVNYITVSCKPLNTAQNCLAVYIKEAYPVTTLESGSTVPVIRYSYSMAAGNTLSGSGGSVLTDTNGFFSSVADGNYLVISSPSSVAGQYQILSVSNNNTSVTISQSLPSFTDGYYQILNTSTPTSGFQNGFFTFELDGYAGTAYNLVQGTYEFSYYTYLSVPIDADTYTGYVGTDINGSNLFDGVINQLQILSEKITDTRIGESSSGQSITKDYNSLIPPSASINTLFLCPFSAFPFENIAPIYSTLSGSIVQSLSAVNSNFNQSIVITDKPYIIDNAGILDTKHQGTIEFWINPHYDTYNDPNNRYYFDASSLVSEEVVSINNATVKISGTASQILSVKVKIANQNKDYFAGGSIGSDNQTIYLNNVLPNQNTTVIVNYIPSGTNGDRISIYKDNSGYLNFSVNASSILYSLRAPIFWSEGTWHRVKASFKFNQGNNLDEIRLFVDGYEQGDVSFNNGLLFGQGQVFGSSSTGSGVLTGNITFKDTINQLFIGSDYLGNNTSHSLFDNLRISNISRPLFKPYGDSIDINYNKNLNTVFPVTSDLYTTFLMDFDTVSKKQTQFATLVDQTNGIFDFSVKVFDSFGYIKSSSKVKSVLETLLDTLKPANSRIFITYD